MMTVRFRKLTATAKTPLYQTRWASGMDLCADGSVSLFPGCSAVVPTGISIELPAGLEGQVRPRSGLAAKYGITVLNAPGTVDADYRGEIKVILLNTSNEIYTVSVGDRIAQLVIAPVVQVSLEEVTELTATDRGDGGLGSTGAA